MLAGAQPAVSPVRRNQQRTLILLGAAPVAAAAPPRLADGTVVLTPAEPPAVAAGVP